MKPSRDHTVAYAADIARTELSACVTDSGIAAGTHHFVDLWARDSLFATFGATAVGLAPASRLTIDAFLSRQRSDGLVPFLIRRSRLTPGKYFGRHAYYREPVARFRSSQSWGIVPDGGLLAVIAAGQYAEEAYDLPFVRKRYPELSAAIGWYADRFGDGLVREWFQCEWADAVMKLGSTLYTNVLYWKALGVMAFIARRTGNRQDAASYRTRQVTVGTAIRSALWNGSYFADWKNVFRHDYFATHPNMLAVVFGFATRTESERIMHAAQTLCWNGWTLENNSPKYPYWRIPIINYLTGTSDYHNRGCLWLQPGLLYALALFRTNQRTPARRVFSGIAERIVRYGGVYEVYETDGSPVRRLLYRSERPFAWSAGLFLWIWHILYGR